MSVAIQLADRVVASLNTGPLSATPIAVRHYVPLFDLEQLTTPRVSVVPRSIEIENLSRRDGLYTYAIDVALQAKITTTNVNIDALMNQVESIADHFRGKPLDGEGHRATCTTIRNVPIYAPEHLDKFRVFTSVVTLEFTVAR